MSGATPRRRARTRPVRIDGRDYLTTGQVAAYLGVRTQTVYAYVSRGVLQRTTIRGQRGSFFALSEVEEVAARGRQPRSSVPGDRVHTQITLLDPDGRLAYRGRDVTELVRAGAGFEEACAILWQLDEPPRLDATDAERARAAAVLPCLPPGSRGIDLVRLVVDVLGAGDPLRGDLRPDAVTALAGRVLGAVVDTLLLARGGPARPAGRLAPRLHAALATGPFMTGGDRLVDAALLLLADHDLAMSTRAARVSASVRAHPYAVLSSALGAMDSPLHGAAPRAAYRLVADVRDDEAATVAGVVSAVDPPPGFGHRLYRERDPRADALLDLIREFAPDHEALVAADALVHALAASRGTFPTSDFALGVLAHVLGLRPEAGEVIFAVGRAAGWIAHAMEEYEADPLRYRIAGVYTGARPS